MNKKATKLAAFDAEALFSKSQLYIRRAIEARDRKSTEEYYLWASLSLELLGKAALSGVHPALVADPLHFESLFAACGISISQDVKTITAKTLFERLSHVNAEFDTRIKAFCTQIVLRRNAELHSGESPFTGLQLKNWEQSFWVSIDIVLRIQSKNIEEWIGTENGKLQKKFIEATLEAIKHVVSTRIEEHSRVFKTRFVDEALRKEMIKKSFELNPWNFTHEFELVADRYTLVSCPSCGANGVGAGNLWATETVDEEMREDGLFEMIQESYLVEEFWCSLCGLHLRGMKEIGLSKIEPWFYYDTEKEKQYEEEYGNE